MHDVLSTDEVVFDREQLASLLAWSEPPIALLDRVETDQGEHVREVLALEIDGQVVRGILTRPPGLGPFPTILYAHSHGGNYDIGAEELVIGQSYLLDPYGPVLARAGYLTLAIDMPCFGQRGGESESAAAKALLWFGKSLLGKMLDEQAAAVSYLLTRSDVDASRIGALGMSMGATLSYFHAALDPRIQAVAHLCCLADQGVMVALGAHDGHGIYMSVPGLLLETDFGEIAGLVAPRPQLVCIGEADRLTPKPAFDSAWAALERGYADHPEAVDLVVELGVGHQETQAMRDAVLWFFERHLGEGALAARVS